MTTTSTPMRKLKISPPCRIKAVKWSHWALEWMACFKKGQLHETHSLSFKDPIFFFSFFFLYIYTHTMAWACMRCTFGCKRTREISSDDDRHLFVERIKSTQNSSVTVTSHTHTLCIMKKKTVPFELEAPIQRKVFRKTMYKLSSRSFHSYFLSLPISFMRSGLVRSFSRATLRLLPHTHFSWHNAGAGAGVCRIFWFGFSFFFSHVKFYHHVLQCCNKQQIHPWTPHMLDRRARVHPPDPHTLTLSLALFLVRSLAPFRSLLRAVVHTIFMYVRIDW